MLHGEPRHIPTLRTTGLKTLIHFGVIVAHSFRGSMTNPHFVGADPIEQPPANQAVAAGQQPSERIVVSPVLIAELASDAVTPVVAET